MRCGLLPPTRYDFYPRPPRGGRPCSCRRRVPPGRNFYPRPPRGGRQRGCGEPQGSNQFLSTPSARRATRRGRKKQSLADFYPRPPRGGRLCAPCKIRFETLFLSTPSARRATDVKATAYNKALISIHALREEGDVCWLYIRFVAKRFLSTPSARRATSTYRFDSGKVFNFYPRPPRGGRRAEAAKNRAWQISIHALREEGDSAHLAKSGLKLYFYPRPPRGGRHHRPYSQYLQQNISIHALREEGDR